MQKPQLKKMEIWMGDQSNLDYRYAFVRRDCQKMDAATAVKAIGHFVNSSDSSESGDLRIDFIGGEPMLEHKTISSILDNSVDIQKKSGKNLKFRIITNGLHDSDQRDLIKNSGLEVRNSLTSMNPTDSWWHDAPDDDGPPEDKITGIKTTFNEFHHRLIISRDNPGIKERVEKLLDAGAEAILLVPRMKMACTTQDGPAAEESMKEYTGWFKSKLVAGEVPPVVNSIRLLSMIHAASEGNPVTVKNHCSNTHERLTLDTDETFRTCRHFSEYPGWSLGNVEDDILMDG